MRRLRWLLAIPAVLLLGHLGAAGALAHPLGNFTVNRYNELAFQPGLVTVAAIVDMAEIPALQTIGLIDRDGSGMVDPGEGEAYQGTGCAELAEQLDLRVGGTPVALQPAQTALSFPPGTGGLLTLRLSCELRGPLGSLDGSASVAFADHSYADRLGWREIVVRPGGLAVRGEVASASASAQLQRYPEDLLSSPLDQRSASFTLLAEAAAPAAPEPLGVPAARPGDQLSALLASPEQSLPAMLAALGLAFVWGAAHALAPGHGKTIVAAYLVGARGTVRHALFLGLTTTITHTAGVFALGLITLFAARVIAPERLFPWLSLLSGGMVAALGFAMLRGRLAGLGRRSNDHSHSHAHLHDHGHGHGHDHSHDHDHSHTPPETISWRNLLLLGVSGGLLPCPSALVVLLGAIALGRVGLGLVLVLAFSLGLAGLLTAIGVAFVYAGRAFGRLPGRPAWTRLVPVASAALVALLGCGLTLRALADLGAIWL